jgi:flagellar biogenesis protein FliO
MEYVRQMIGMAAVLGLLGAALGWLRRRGLRMAEQSSRRRLQTLERLPLSPQHTLHLVRAGEEELVVACSPGGCALLGRMPAPRLEEVEAGR